MKIEKAIDKEGKTTILIDGKILGYEISRALTGTTGEETEGIFAEKRYELFYYGDYKNSIYFGQELSQTYPVKKYAEILTTRIQKVRDWVKECRDTAGTVEIKNLPEAAEKLAEEGRLYYRNIKGQIKPLD